MSCRIKEFKIPECVPTILIEIGIEREDDILYNLVITDKFGNKYTNELELDEGGYLVFDTTDEVYPENLLTQYSGSFKLEVYNVNNCTNETLNFCENIFDTYQFTFYKENNPPEYFTLCCN